MEDEKTLDTAFKELDSLIDKMGEKDLPLEDAFKLYEQGMELVRYCNGTIDKVEKKIIEIRGEEGN